MFYDELTLDLDAITFEADEKSCLLCGPYGASGTVILPAGGLKMCLCCHGTGRKGSKAHSVQPEVFQSNREDWT